MSGDLKLFISYRRTDDPGGVGRLFDRLKDHYGGDNVFIDVDGDIQVGLDFRVQLETRVQQADVVLAIMGPRWLSAIQEKAEDPSDYLRLELEAALKLGIPVVPVLMGTDVGVPSADALPPSISQLSYLHGVTIDLGTDFHAHVTRLIEKLDRHQVVEETTPSQPVAASPEPAPEAEPEPVAVTEQPSQPEPAAVSPEPAVEAAPTPASAPSSTSSPEPSSESSPSKSKPGVLFGVLGGVAPIVALAVGLPALTGGDSAAGGPPPVDKTPPFEPVSSAGLELVWCEPGDFSMGSPESEEDRDDSERQHEVTFSDGFWIASYEVTPETWLQVMEELPPGFTGGTSSKPLHSVSWQEAMEFCKQLTQQEQAAGNLPEGWIYTLPTEAQWEYACRAGTETPFSFGEVLRGEQANCNGTYPYGTEEEGTDLGEPAAVGSYEPNPWGIYDMHGNVAEWCLGWFGEYPKGEVTDPGGAKNGQARVVRGGSWVDLSRQCRSAHRYSLKPDTQRNHVGFRVVLAQAGE